MGTHPFVPGMYGDFSFFILFHSKKYFLEDPKPDTISKSTESYETAESSYDGLGGA